MSENSYDDEVDQYYKEFYARIHSSGSLGFANRVLHKKLEFQRNGRYEKVLELGCGNFEHIPFVSHEYIAYVATDIRIPPKELQEQYFESNSGNSFQIEDATQLSFEDRTFDRVLAGCLMVHLVDVKKAITEWQRVAKIDGVIDFVIPCDPGFLLRLFRRLISVPNAKKYSVSKEVYELVNAYEHISSFPRTLRIIESSIEPGRNLRVKYFPFRFVKSWNLNAFAIISVYGDIDDK